MSPHKSFASIKAFLVEEMQGARLGPKGSISEVTTIQLEKKMGIRQCVRGPLILRARTGRRSG